jgi:hypothetical protein
VIDVPHLFIDGAIPIQKNRYTHSLTLIVKLCSPQKSQKRQSEDVRPRGRVSKISKEQLPPLEMVSQFAEVVIPDESAYGGRDPESR